MRFASRLSPLLILCVLQSSLLGQGFGGAVLVADGEVLVGEPTSEREPGTVRVFRASDGAEIAMIRAPDAAVRDRFGTALARSGSTLFASAPDADGGAVHVFRRVDGVWQHVSEIRSQGLHDFGRTLAAAGEHVLIGATETSTEKAVVVVYREEATLGWILEARLAPSGDAQGFGVALSMAGYVALIGAPAAEERSGAAYLFGHDVGHNWSEVARLTGSGDDRAAFGSAVATRGDVALVGAPGQDRGSGAVYRFGWQGDAGWVLAETIQPDDTNAAAGFGAGIAVDGATAFVGAPVGSGGNGRVYELGETATGWRIQDSWSVEGEGTVQAGAILAAGGGIGVVGLPSDDFGAGSAWVSTSDGLTRIASEQIGLEAIAGAQVDCVAGSAGRFDCDRVDLLSFLPREELGAGRGARLNDVWGWTDPDTGSEYAIVGRMDGTAFVDVTDPLNPRYLGDLPKTEGSQSNTWRDTKVFDDHAFIVADGAGQHGMQVFDLFQLREVSAPRQFEADSHYDGVASAHNIVINEDTGFAYLVGASDGGETCGGGSHIVDLNDPLSPVFAGCFQHEGTGRRNTGNTHDAQCVLYHGPDTDYAGREICMSSNETALSISDVTDKSNPVAISTGTYPSISYAHQGWLTEDHRYFFSNDEADEVNGSVEATRTLVWDVRDLDDPLLAKEYYSPTKATDHNLYVREDRLYMSNNRSGLRVVDISDPENPEEIGFFDTTPWSEDSAGFDGTWSVYPYLESGTILLSSRREGLFLVKPRDDGPVP